tara:strand:+ start:246 stop:1469 length:1224 start_codon:yes stop_codon:yes gene_type:complete
MPYHTRQQVTPSPQQTDPIDPQQTTTTQTTRRRTTTTQRTGQQQTTTTQQISRQTTTTQQSETASSTSSQQSMTTKQQDTETILDEQEEILKDNPIVQVNLQALPGQFVFKQTGEEYVGPYHLHQNGDRMIRAGTLGVVHELLPEEIIVPVQQQALEEEVLINPIVEVGLVANEEDNWYFADPKSDYLLPNLLNPYVGLYHLHEDGTAMINEGVLGVVHELKPEEIIIQSLISQTTMVQAESANVVEEVSYETIQAVREIVSDVIYKKWFENNTLSDEQILSMQTTIRDGKKQTGRNENEPLVFYKKDRNTLENREDLQGENFEQICQNIHENFITDIESKFNLVLPDEIDYSNPFDSPLEPGEYFKLQQYVIRYNNDGLIIDVVIAEEAILYYDEALIQTQESGGS